MVMPLREGRYRSEGVAGPGGKTSQTSADDRAFVAKSNRGVDGGLRGKRRHAQVFAVDNGLDEGAMRRGTEVETSPEVDSDLLTRTSWTNASVAINEIRKVNRISSFICTRSYFCADSRFYL